MGSSRGAGSPAPPVSIFGVGRYKWAFGGGGVEPLISASTLSPQLTTLTSTSRLYHHRATQHRIKLKTSQWKNKSRASSQRSAQRSTTSLQTSVSVCLPLPSS